jgi:hypothetical protein
MPPIAGQRLSSGCPGAAECERQACAGAHLASGSEQVHASLGSDLDRDLHFAKRPVSLCLLHTRDDLLHPANELREIALECGDGHWARSTFVLSQKARSVSLSLTPMTQMDAGGVLAVGSVMAVLLVAAHGQIRIREHRVENPERVLLLRDHIPFRGI